ncbi:MAG: segregation and condensation protein A [Myxococcota bacterium]
MTTAGPPPSDGTPGTPDPLAGATDAIAREWSIGDSGYAVKLPIFEGPLDLLLHLIRIDEVDITDIPIARVAEQYLEYLELMRELQLDIAGEYLVMAATLAWIKSRMLLPPDPSAIADEGVDPRAELVARLLEYQRFKEVAGEIGERSLLGRDVFPAREPVLEAAPEAEREIEVGLFELVEAMRRALARGGHTGAAHEVEIETITVRERIMAVMEVLAAREACEFEDLLAGDARTRALIVATFLAILELTRLEAIGLYQGLDELGVPRGPIHLRRRGDAGDSSWEQRVSELM